MNDNEILEATAAGIESVVAEWRPKLIALEEDVARHKPTPERWAIAEVIGHLVDSACNNHQRFIRAQFCDDELVFPKYDQNQWAAAANYAKHDWGSLVELWCHYNSLIATVIRNIPEEALSKKCTITPYDPCTLEFLVTDYLTHLHHHFKILDGRIK